MSLTPPAQGWLPSGRAFLFLGAIWAATLLGVVWLARSVDWSMVGEALAAARPVWVVAALAANLLGLPIWICAWRLLIPARGRPGWGALVEAQSVTLAAIQTLLTTAVTAVAVWLMHVSWFERLYLRRRYRSIESFLLFALSAATAIRSPEE